MGVVGFEFDGAVDVVVVEDFVEVSAVAEDAEGEVSAIDIPLLGEFSMGVAWSGGSMLYLEPLVGER